MPQLITESDPVIPWWRGAMHDVCVLEFRAGMKTFEAATTFERVEKESDGAESLRFRYFPDASVPTSLPSTIRLIIPTEDGTATYHLRVVASEGTTVCVSPEPLSVDTRRLRRSPRVPYQLGPCAAVVHGANGQWRGVIEFWVWDVSEAGVGFKAELGRAFLLSVGDTVRAPVTLPDGRRSWFDGRVAWLNPEGRGGITVRQAPQWFPSQEQSA